MRTILQVVYGLIVGIAGVVALTFLAILFKGQPDWQTVAAILAILAVGQGIAFLVFRERISTQVFFGLVLCMIASIALIYSKFSFIWETPNPDESVSLTWRSDVVLVALLAATQLLSAFIFRGLRRIFSLDET